MRTGSACRVRNAHRLTQFQRFDFEIKLWFVSYKLNRCAVHTLQIMVCEVQTQPVRSAHPTSLMWLVRAKVRGF